MKILNKRSNVYREVWFAYLVILLCYIIPQIHLTSAFSSGYSRLIKKCCPRNYYFDGVCVKKNFSLTFNIPLYNGYKMSKNLTNVKQMSVVNGKNMKLCSNVKLFDEYYIQTNGTLWVPMYYSTLYYNTDEFCVEYIRTKKLLAFVCYEIVGKSLAIIIKASGMIISMPFLLITFIVYALLPDRNLHMKALMCYVLNLFFAYIFLVSIQLTDDVIENILCAILGFGTVFFFLASFFWMNVICVDIFLGFRGFRGVPGVRGSERKRFLLYCLYAWGMSLLIVVITFFFNQIGSPGQWFFPGVAVGQCFIRNGIPQLLYFYGPMGFIIILNVILFTLTALKIRQVKKDTAMLKHSESKRHSDDDQQNFNLYLKLLLAMGVNWTMELVSWAVNLNSRNVPQYIWYLSDFCNAIYGVFIFFIFVFKRNIWKQLKRRYYNFTGRHHLAHSMTTTNHTKTTNDSMTMSTNDRLEESELNVTRVN